MSEEAVEKGLTIPVMRTKSGYASTGGLMGLFAKRCSTLGARAACWKSLGEGRMLMCRRWRCFVRPESNQKVGARCVVYSSELGEYDNDDN